MYEPGDVKLLTPPCPDALNSGSCNRGWIKEGHAHTLRHKELAPCAFLSHSCDEWVIGGPQAVRQMIADLTAALATMEGQHVDPM